MSSYADHQRMVTIEQRAATLETRVAELERMVRELRDRPIPQAIIPVPDTMVTAAQPTEPPSPYEQWAAKKAARRTAE